MVRGFGKFWINFAFGCAVCARSVAFCLFLRWFVREISGGLGFWGCGGLVFVVCYGWWFVCFDFFIGRSFLCFCAFCF